MRRMRPLLASALLICTLGLTTPAVATTGVHGTYDTALQYRNGPMYEHSRAARMTRKLGRGLLNVVFFWCEIPHYVNQDAQNVDFFTGVLTGTGKGLIAGGRRLALGLYDVFTFPVEIPENYQDLQETEFVFEGDLD